MNGNNNMNPWVLGVFAVVIIIGGLLLWNSKNAAPQTTDQTATTTDSTKVVKETRPASDIVSIIDDIPEASTFASLFRSSGVAASLSSTGTYTVFVPTNNSFGLLPKGYLSGLSPTQEKRVVQYHVVSGKRLDIDAVNSGRITALSKDILNFLVTDSGQSVQINSAFAIKSYTAKNGIIYLINGVLIPPEKGLY